MSTKVKLFIVSAGLVIVGVPLLLFADTKGPEPMLVCAEKNGPTSGYMDKDQDCPVSVESMQEWGEWSSKPQPVKIAGLFIGLVGILLAIGTGIAALVQKLIRKNKPEQPAQTPSA